ncbi:hypothetical protein V8C86DRAFT_2749136 [Haematococcus lacustris]
MQPTRSLVGVLCLQILSRCAVSGNEEELLLGWRGETYNPQKHNASSLPWVETISWQPRAFVHHSFLTHQECDHLKRLAQGRLERSGVVGDDEDSSGIDDIRTSYSAAIKRQEDGVVAGIEQRIAHWTHLPEENGEPLEVQKYGAHWDWFGRSDRDHKTLGSDRVATVLIYLADVGPGSGGETSLPLAQALDSQLQSTRGMSHCATRMGLAVLPRKGDALLFWNTLPDVGVPDRRALHASCPTFRGEKWTATKWIHGLPY